MRTLVLGDSRIRVRCPIEFGTGAPFIRRDDTTLRMLCYAHGCLARNTVGRCTCQLYAARSARAQRGVGWKELGMYSEVLPFSNA
jgi:hypothetical protein